MLSAWAQRCQDARVQEGETLGDLLVPAMAIAPDKVAIYFEDREITYRELDEAANRVANGLIGMGV